MKIRKTLKILGIISGIGFGLSLSTLGQEEKNNENFSSLLKSNIITNQELVYKSVKIGSSDLYIKLPFILSPSTVNHPQSNLDKLIKSEVFIFSKDKTFQGKISYVTYKKDVEFSVEKGTDGGIENIKALPGVEKVIEKREYFKKNLIEGCIYDATVYRYGKSFGMKGATLKSGKESWTIIITFLDSKDQHIANNILNSLR
nr:hypothetical protein [Pseudopedobacter sp.]